ncbi:MAG: M20 family metallo-hydrolase [Halanaeroarchaeum sp.]
MTPIDVDADRLKRDIEATAAFGATDDSDRGRGRTVRTGTEADRKARDYLVDRLREADLEVTVDGVGNVMGVWYPDGTTTDDPPVVAGSHLDSVPQGGIFDGPLGVYAALEAVRAIAASEYDPDHPLGVVSFTEEEGTRFPPLLGSSVATGQRTVDDARQLADDDGTTLETALERIDYLGEGRLDAERWGHWLEVHVEQGTRLTEAGVPAGVVTDITGISQMDVRFEGEANHAGTTPMDARSDALAGAAELVSAVENRTQALFERSPTVVGTVGSIDVRPNGTNVIPGEVDLGIDIRDVERATMDELHEHVRRTADRIADERGLDAAVSKRIDVDPTPLDENSIEAIRRGAQTAGVDVVELHSGAGHDTMHVARATSAGMIFAPSVDGISHSPREWTDWEDCTVVTEILAETMAELA